jgi:hypothetical protein
MAGQPEIKNMALFCDLENIALGVREAKYPQFDMKRVLERLLLKGSIVVKKATGLNRRSSTGCIVSLIEIPHASGKNLPTSGWSMPGLATPAHVDAFGIFSGTGFHPGL